MWKEEIKAWEKGGKEQEKERDSWTVTEPIRHSTGRLAESPVPPTTCRAQRPTPCPGAESGRGPAVSLQDARWAGWVRLRPLPPWAIAWCAREIINVSASAHSWAHSRPESKPKQASASSSSPGLRSEGVSPCREAQGPSEGLQGASRGPCTSPRAERGSPTGLSLKGPSDEADQTWLYCRTQTGALSPQETLY